MASRMLQVVIGLAVTLLVSGRQEAATITSKGEISTTSGRKVVRSLAKGQVSPASEWKVVVRTEKAKTANVANTTARKAHCVATKDARYLLYPKDALYKYDDFDTESDALAKFEEWENFGELAAVKFSNGVKDNTYGSYFTHDLYNMALVCGISLNGTTPWSLHQSCQPGEVVDAANECQIAGPFLGKKYDGIVSDNSVPPGCHVSGDKSIYNVLTSSTSVGEAICRVTTTTTTALPKTVYTGVLKKLASFSSHDYDGFEGSVRLEATAYGIGTFVKMNGTHGGTHPGELRNAMRSKVFEAHLHAMPCADGGGGHYIDTASGEENWPEVTCDDNADCFGKAHNAWVPTSITSLSIVVHDTPHDNAKAFCADLSESSSMISEEVGASADEAEPPKMLKVATTITTTALAVKPESTTSTEILKAQTTATAEAATPVALKEDPCNDGHKFCGDWAKQGECGKNPGYMLTVCRAACTQCKSAPQQPVLAQTK